MYELTLNNGDTLTTSGAGTYDGYLWIYGLSVNITEAAGIFGDASRTEKITVHYQESIPDSVFEGYTILHAVMMDEGSTKVCLKKA